MSPDVRGEHFPLIDGRRVTVSYDEKAPEIAEAQLASCGRRTQLRANVAIHAASPMTLSSANMMPAKQSKYEANMQTFNGMAR